MNEFTTINVKLDVKQEIVRLAKAKGEELGIELSQAKFIEYLIQYYKDHAK